MAIDSIRQRVERFSSLHRRTMVGGIALVICVGSAFALTVAKRSHRRAPSIPPPVIGTSFLPSSQGKANTAQPTPAAMEVETIAITAHGLEPSELRRPANPFLLKLVNHGRPSAFSFEISRVNGQKLHELNGKKGQQRQSQIIDLPPGQYVLKELSHPELSCTILLSAK